MEDKQNFERVGLFGNGGGQGRNEGKWKYMRLEMPLFDGSDLASWILRGENFFDIYRLTEEEKLDAAVVSMEGDALRWFHFENHPRPVKGWRNLKEGLCWNFDPSTQGRCMNNGCQRHKPPR